MAKLKSCKDCGKEISKSAKVCPNCGKKQNNPVLGAIIGIISICLIVSGINSIIGNSKTEDKSSVYLEEGHNGYADSAGFAYYIEGTVKNDTSKDYSYIQITFNAYDEEHNNLGTCLANNNNVKSGESWKFKAICSGEAKSVKTYEFVEITKW